MWFKWKLKILTLPYSPTGTIEPTASSMGASGKCRRVVQGGPERSWSTKGGCGPCGPPGPLRSILIHTFWNSTENVDQGGSGWIRVDQGDHNPPWCTRTGFYILLMDSRGQLSTTEKLRNTPILPEELWEMVGILHSTWDASQYTMTYLELLHSWAYTLVYQHPLYVLVSPVSSWIL